MEIFLDKVALPENIQKNRKGEPKKVTRDGVDYVLVDRNPEKGSKCSAYIKIYALTIALLGSFGIAALFEKFQTLMRDNFSILKNGERKIYTYNLLEARKEKSKDEKTAEKTEDVAADKAKT